MTRTDPSSTSKTVLAIVPASYASTTTSATGIDVSDFRTAKIIAGFGVMGADATLIVQESDVLASGYTTVTGGTFVLASGTYAGINALVDLDLSPRKKFVRVQLVTTTACLASVEIVLGTMKDTRNTPSDESTREAFILA